MTRSRPGQPAREGYFAETSVVRQVWREAVVALGGLPRMLLIEAAHPLVATGISGHSAFRVSPWRRLMSTVHAYCTLVFGTRAEADGAAEGIRSRHATVRGRLDRRAGRFPAGTAYAADDPDLLSWVHAACVDTALVMYRTFVRRLSPELEEEFYGEMQVVGALLGIPKASMPPTLDDFYADLCARLAEDPCATPAARDIAELALNPPVPAELRPLTALTKAVTIATLPREIRAVYGLERELASRLVLAAAAPSLRVLIPFLPRQARLLWGASSRRGPGGITFGLVAALAERDP
ncbi:MAG TPA: oxygenase MpaB family protein [Gaiellaceae bacterium]|nr:oxygenase MpaB family protein [Gaiellaceae bacterium]